MKTSKKILIGVGVFLLLLLITWGICETAGSDYYNYSGHVIDITEENGDTVFTLNVPAEVADKKITPVTTERLGTPRIVEQAFEDPNGDPIDFTIDILGNKRDGNIVAGPFARLCAGENKFVVWKNKGDKQ